MKTSAGADGTARLVLLGASNLTFGLGRVIELARRRAAGPLEVRVAAGFGRSYGRSTRVLGRTLPGLVDCGLWRRLEDGGSALVTDIGNDLAYGESPRQVLAWVGECLDRLAGQGIGTALVLPPRRSLHALPRWRYQLIKGLLFPGRRLPFGVLLERLDRLETGLVELCHERRIRCFEPSPAWFGPDGIHHRRRLMTRVWSRQLAAVGAPFSHPGRRAVQGPRRLSLAGARPERVRFFGVARRRAQPCDPAPSVALWMY